MRTSNLSLFIPCKLWIQSQIFWFVKFIEIFFIFRESVDKISKIITLSLFILCKPHKTLRTSEGVNVFVHLCNKKFICTNNFLDSSVLPLLDCNPRNIIPTSKLRGTFFESFK